MKQPKTAKELLESLILTICHYGGCPAKYGMKVNKKCCGYFEIVQCKNCWLSAIKDLR
jgi:hypothetical protein